MGARKNGCLRRPPLFSRLLLPSDCYAAKPKGKLEICHMGVVQRKNFPYEILDLTKNSHLGQNICGEKVGGRLPRIILI